MRKLVIDEKCRTLYSDIDLGELRMRALYDAKCSVWKSEHLRDHVEKETDCSFRCSFTSESGTRCQFNSTTRRGLISHMVKAHGFYDPVQRAAITNECPWYQSIFSTRLDAHRHAFVIPARFLPRRRKPGTNRSQAATVACCVSAV